MKATQTIAYRYCDDLAKKAREAVKDHYNHFVEYHGSNLVVYPDGNSMAVDMKRQYNLYNESKLEGASPSSVESQNHQLSDFTKSFPPEFLESDNGVCVYFNPDEGQEIMQEYYDLINGFRKKGIDLSRYEIYAIRGFITSESISPSFVKKLVEKYGDESVSAAFLIPNDFAQYYLEYLLRQHKGDFYRKRYPSISFVQA